MSNKKRIRKLLQKKYQPSKTVNYFDQFEQIGKAAENAAKQFLLTCNALHGMSLIMLEYFEKFAPGKELSNPMAGILSGGRGYGKTASLNNFEIYIKDGVYMYPEHPTVAIPSDKKYIL